MVLIEEQRLLRESLAHLLATCAPDAHVEHFARVEDVPPGPACLVLIGADLAKANAAEFAEEYWSIKQICGNAPVGAIVLGDDADFVGGLRALGVVGIINHESSAAVVVAAVKLMAVGGYCLPPETLLSPKLALGPIQAISAASVRPEPLENSKAGLDELRLTARERDIMRCLREGRQNKFIAYELGISESTVKVHLRNIMKKLHASNRTQSRSVASGWIDGLPRLRVVSRGFQISQASRSKRSPRGDVAMFAASKRSLFEIASLAMRGLAPSKCGTRLVDNVACEARRP